MTLVGIGPRLFDGLRRPVDYNGFWHVFIARNLSREWLNLQHPPLFLVLLRVADSLGHSPLVYRSISLAAGSVSVYLFGRILWKLGCSPAVQVLGALTAALAYNAITLSNEVESYALGVALLLGSFCFYLDLVATEPPRLGSRVGFAFLSSLALASHYFSGLFLVVCVLLGIVAAGVRMRRKEEPHPIRRWALDFATIIPPLVVGAELYERQAKRWVMPLSSLPSFYFRPQEERLSNFLVRNTREVFNLFAPFSLPRARYALPILALFIAAILRAPLSEERDQSRGGTRLLPAFSLVLLLILGMILGSLGLYPFGGLMRHQFLFFVYAVLAGAVAFDRLLRSTAAPPARRGLLAAGLTFLVANFALRAPALAHPEPYRLRPLVEQASREFVDRGRVNVDQFGLVGLFSVYDDWAWRLLGADTRAPYVERYEVRHQDRAFTVVAFRNWWIFDFRDAKLYGQFRRLWEKEPRSRQPVFAAYGTVFDRPERQKFSAGHVAELRRLIGTLSAGESLLLRELRVSDYGDVYAEFSVEP